MIAKTSMVQAGEGWGREWKEVPGGPRQAAEDGHSVASGSLQRCKSPISMFDGMDRDHSIVSRLRFPSVWQSACQASSSLESRENPLCCPAS